ncbi:hypothetical protein MJG53_007569 [Ovis ammon polii x Ovis aries]|uniref:Uncharacterized protein n=2 Tax=Ovis TaxID=9935 RepID=A0A836D5Q4_SHEEP|nr:hypothetical protein JEQ12_016810 [Ovis aries]KAI4584290.1 hypothetical protein MJG53_007569 [Ovis ammon polii x Ovis aries]
MPKLWDDYLDSTQRRCSCDALEFLSDYYDKMCSGDGMLLKTRKDQQEGLQPRAVIPHSPPHPTLRHGFSLLVTLSLMFQESCKAEPRVLSSLRLLEEDNPEPPSQQLQATGSGGSESLSNLDLSHGPLVALECLPFFRTYGQLLAEEELVPRPEVFRDQGGDQSVREEDSELPSSFFPHYRSKEESFPSLALPGGSRAGSRGPPTRREMQACCRCTRTVSGDCSLSALWSNVVCRAPAYLDRVDMLSGAPTPGSPCVPQQRALRLQQVDAGRVLCLGLCTCSLAAAGNRP